MGVQRQALPLCASNWHVLNTTRETSDFFQGFSESQLQKKRLTMSSIAGLLVQVIGSILTYTGGLTNTESNANLTKQGLVQVIDFF